MVFYEQLPIELWLIIYKMEHQTMLAHVNHSIIALRNDDRGWSWRSHVDPIYSEKAGLVYNFTCCNWENGTPEDITMLMDYWNNITFNVEEIEETDEEMEADYCHDCQQNTEDPCYCLE
jgi:hypothetical protein